MGHVISEPTGNWLLPWSTIVEGAYRCYTPGVSPVGSAYVQSTMRYTVFRLGISPLF